MIPSTRFAHLVAASALLALACGGSSPGPGSISGKVALEGVTGSLEGSFLTVGTVAVATGADGAYSLDGIAPGEVAIRVSHEGFVGEERTVAVTAGKAASADFQLSRTNVSPVISALSAAPAALDPSGTSELLASASDADGDALTFAWSADHGFTVTPGEGGGASLTAPDTFAASGTVTVTVSDGRGGTASAQLQVSTHGNHAPVLSALSATPALARPGQSLTLAASAEDAEGTDLSYAWTVPAGWTLTGTGATVQLQAPAQYGQSGEVTVEVGDPDGLTAIGQLTVGTAADRAPVVSSLWATPPQVQKGGSLTLHASASDPDGDPLGFAWSAPDGWTLTADGESATVVAPAMPDQTATIQLVVDDGFGQTAQASLVVTTAANVAPELSGLTAAASELLPGQQTALSATASDADGDPLTYTWSVDNPDWTLSGTGATATATAPGTYLSSATVTLSVDDGLGGVATSSVPLTTSAPPCTPVAATLQFEPVATESDSADPFTHIAQSLTPTEDFVLTSVVLPLYTCKSNGLVDAQVRFTATTPGGLPDESLVLATSALVPNSELADACTGGDHFADVRLSLPLPVPLRAGISYAIILDTPLSPGETSGGLYWRRSSTPTDPKNPYPGGLSLRRSSPWDWTPDDRIDLAFELEGAQCATTP